MSVYINENNEMVITADNSMSDESYYINTLNALLEYTKIESSDMPMSEEYRYSIISLVQDMLPKPSQLNLKAK